MIQINYSSREGRTSRFTIFPLDIIGHAVMVASLLPLRPINAFALSLPKKLPSLSHPIISNARIKSMITNNHRPNSTGEDRYSLDLSVPTADDMEDLGGLLSVDSGAGDALLLDGDLGAGKTCFARGFVRGRTGATGARVTSPTYLLSNTYSADGGRTNIYHMDLYRLSGEGDLAPLSLEHVFANGISLIEWPSRLIEKPPQRLEVTLSIDSASHHDGDGTDSKSRHMKLVPYGDRWLKRLQFLESEGYFDDLLIPFSTA